MNKVITKADAIAILEATPTLYNELDDTTIVSFPFGSAGGAEIPVVELESFEDNQGKEILEETVLTVKRIIEDMEDLMEPINKELWIARLGLTPAPEYVPSEDVMPGCIGVTQRSEFAVFSMIMDDEDNPDVMGDLNIRLPYSESTYDMIDAHNDEHSFNDGLYDLIEEQKSSIVWYNLPKDTNLIT